jgi:hypothetical protein
MLKKFFHSLILKRIYYSFLIIFGLLFSYHIVRFYFLNVGCEYILGTLNQYIEITAYYTGMISVPLSVTQIVSNVLNKNYKLLIINTILLISVLAMLWLLISNILLECFLRIR